MKKLPLKIEVETRTVLRKTAQAHKALAELKGAISSIPNENILIETLVLREARESSAVENIISTFDEVYQSNFEIQQFASPAAKEVHLYAKALKTGFNLVSKNNLLTVNNIIQIQKVVEQNSAGFRKLPGTKLLNDKTGEVIYIPPQKYETIVELMSNLEKFINDDEMMDVDALIKMAIIHHQFESIHPFYDGNGRTGRIINILFLIQKKLLNLPVLYLSRFIIQNRNEYYRLLQQVRETGEWENWILYMLNGIEQTANETIILINNIRVLMQQYKQQIRAKLPKLYSQDILNNFFKYPYTKIEYLQADSNISRNTAIRYLDAVVKTGLLVKEKKGRDNFYINQPLFELLSGKEKMHKESLPGKAESNSLQKEKLIKEICKAIKQKQVIQFYYKDTTKAKEGIRIVEPYILGIKNKGKGNLYLAALPLTGEFKIKGPVKKQLGHYLLSEIKQLEILHQKFTSIKVNDDVVYKTPTIEVICRVSF